MTMEFNPAPEQDMEARERIKEWSREGNAVTNIMNAELGLYKTILTAGAVEKLKDSVFWRMCNFLDDDEAKDWVDCYHEAKDLHMSVDWCIDNVFALCSANRRSGGQNMVGMFLKTFDDLKDQAVKQTNNREQKAGDGNRGSVTG